MLRRTLGAALNCKTLIDQTSSRNLYSVYKSKISLENLYPDSDQNPISFVRQKQTVSQTKDPETEDEPFSGYIPIGDLDIRFSRSSGPGGQNVNKVNTKVEVRFNLDQAEWIPEWIKPKLKEQEESRINNDGDLIVRSDKTRKQILNQADCLDKIRNMIFKASIKPKEPTKEELELMEKRKEIANKKRIEEKRRISLSKARKREFY